MKQRHSGNIISICINKKNLEKVVATLIDIGIASISWFHPEEFMTHTIHVWYIYLYLEKKNGFHVVNIPFPWILWVIGDLTFVEKPSAGEKEHHCWTICFWLEQQKPYFPQTVHPGKLTWNIVMEVWKMIFLFNWVSFLFHVNFQGCTRQ